MRIKLERRLFISRWVSAGMVGLSLAGSFLVMGIVFRLSGVSPVEAYKEMFMGTLGYGYGITEVLVKATPLILTGLSVAVAMRMSIWNIGAEGQLYMGAFAATWAAQTFTGLSPYLLIPVMFLCGAAMGGIWALIAGWLKVRFAVNEILTTLFLNYVAISWVYYLVYGPWRNPGQMGFPITRTYVAAAWLPQFFDSRMHLGLLFGIALAVILYLVIRRTSWGFEIRAIGGSVPASRYAGLKITRNILLVFLLSGALSGVAGMSEISGLHHKLQFGAISADYGYTGIIIACLANGNPLWVIVSALFMGVIFAGGESIKLTMGLSFGMVMTFEGVVLLFLLAGDFFKKYRVQIETGKGETCTL